MLNAMSPVGTLPFLIQSKISETHDSDKRPEALFAFSEYSFLGNERRVLGMVKSTRGRGAEEGTGGWLSPESWTTSLFRSVEMWPRGALFDRRQRA